MQAGRVESAPTGSKLGAVSPVMPRVSVIIPAFNAEASIADALRSVECQTYRDWEIVLADDGSIDRTVEIASGFGSGVKLVRSPGNAGPAAARNLAVEQASGELLALLDADDHWLPDYLDAQVHVYDSSRAAGRRVGIVACDAYVVGPDGRAPRTYMELVGFPDEVTLDVLLLYNPIFVSALVPRAVFEEAGRFCPEIRGTEDHDLWIRIVELGYVVVANRRPLAIYRVHDSSVSANLAGMARALQTTYRRALARGNLNPRATRIARRKLRLQRALEELEEIAAERRVGGGLALSRVARALPLLLTVAAEHPHRWLRGLRMLSRGARRPTLLPPPH